MRPTSRALGLFITGLLLAFPAAATGSQALAGLAGLALSAPVVGLACVLLQHGRARSIDLVRSVQPRHPQAGHWARVTAVPTSATGRVPVWTSVRERVHGAQVARGTGDSDYRLRPARRGLLDLGPAIVLHRDPLGLFSWRRTATHATRLTVWPRTVPLFEEAGLWPGDSQASDAAGRPQPSIDSVSLREYQAGDDLRRVHWRASAHQGNLVVRPEEPRLDESITLVVLLSGAAEQDEALEWAVSAAASWATALLTAGFPLSLHLSPGPAGTRLTEPTEAMHAFALADTGEPQLPGRSGGGTLIAVLASPSAEQLHDLCQLGQARDSRALVIDGAATCLEELAASGWFVHAATSGSDITNVWSRAVQEWSQQ